MVTTCSHIHTGDIDVMEPILLPYKKYHLVQQAQTNDIAYLGESQRTYKKMYMYDDALSNSCFCSKLLSLSEQITCSRCG